MFLPPGFDFDGRKAGKKFAFLFHRLILLDEDHLQIVGQLGFFVIGIDQHRCQV